jgi:hypothetical protein
LIGSFTGLTTTSDVRPFTVAKFHNTITNWILRRRAALVPDKEAAEHVEQVYPKDRLAERRRLCAAFVESCGAAAAEKVGRTQCEAFNLQRSSKET